SFFRFHLVLIPRLSFAACVKILFMDSTYYATATDANKLHLTETVITMLPVEVGQKSMEFMASAGLTCSAIFRDCMTKYYSFVTLHVYFNTYF
ncbi:hypothetical protein L9F63_021298, partial [Diploptera punctata]